MNDFAVEVSELTRVFGRFTAVDHISFSIRRGEIFGFLGPNGAGKSTTIRMLCGLLSSTSGTGKIEGMDINTEAERVRERIGYMSQRFSLYKDLTVRENVAFFGGVYGLTGSQFRERAAAVIRMAGLEGLENRLTGEISGAIQQRLALGCAIVHEPRVLFLDEPTSGVDPISRRHFWDLIRGLAGQGVTILVTTHFMDEAEFCGRIGFINAGQLVALDTPDGIKQRVEEDLFEVNLHAGVTVREQIERIPGILATSFFGTHIHVFTRRGAWSADSLDAALRAAELRPQSVRPTQITLEDAFVRLSQRGVEKGPA